MMASTNKPTSAAPVARRKSTKSSLVVKLKLSPRTLEKFALSQPIKEESPSKDSSSATSNTLPIVASSNSDNPLESASNTPAASGTPAPSLMLPPTEGVKKKAAKRSSAVAFGPDGLPIPKVRGKPGPKKKARLEDGSIDHSSSAPRAGGGTSTHKLGPKANQGAINAGLRALDRSGKPCRKWHRGSFKIKSFTGVSWELPRWAAPAKVTPVSEGSVSGSGDSSKENKDGSQIASEKSNNGPDVEITSAGDKKVVVTDPVPIPTDVPTAVIPPT